MNSSTQNIQVQPDTLKNLVVDVEKGNYRIPQFQREFVWKRPKVIELFDSIYKEFPIGSFFLWKAEREHNKLFRHSIELDIRDIRSDDDVSFILDGQQRVTSLYVTLKGMSVNGTDYSRICFDLKEQKFTARTPDKSRYISVSDIWGPQAVSIMRKVDEAYVKAYERCYQILKTYPVSLVVVRDKDLPAVCKIFQRINQSGQRLDRFDLISAMTFTTDFDLREHFKDDILSKLEFKAFGKISPVVVTQLMALLKKGACTERHEYSLTAGDIQEMWPSIVLAVLLSAETLRWAVGVVNSKYIPYEAMLTLLAYYFAKSGNRSLPAKQLSWVKLWFWRASFSQYYGSGGPTKMGRDKEMFDQLIEGKMPEFNPPIVLSTEKLVATKMTWTKSAIRNAFLCLLAKLEPVHLINNNKLDLVNGGFTGFTSNEKHHIFPMAFLHRMGYSGPEIQALPNFCFVPAELNKQISDSEPADYFKKFEKENPEFKKAARTHLVPFDRNSGIADNDYLKFLQARGKLILEEICRLCGSLSAPKEGERQQAINRFESRIRDCIHWTLEAISGDDYWKQNIPNDILDNAKKRIQSDLKKYPDKKQEDYEAPRVRLDYVNVMDYLTIIVNKKNWSHFEQYFRRKSDIERYLEAFNEYRNVVMHNREMTELIRLGGEMAMIWLETTLPDYEEDDNGTEKESYQS